MERRGVMGKSLRAPPFRAQALNDLEFDFVGQIETCLAAFRETDKARVLAASAKRNARQQENEEDAVPEAEGEDEAAEEDLGEGDDADDGAAEESPGDAEEGEEGEEEAAQ